MFISTDEKKQLWQALQELTEIVNQLRIDVEKAKNGWRMSDGEPRIKLGRPVGSKNKVKS
jgi:hypothetical protein